MNIYSFYSSPILDVSIRRILAAATVDMAKNMVLRYRWLFINIHDMARISITAPPKLHSTDWALSTVKRPDWVSRLTDALTDM
jgi:hypothetical protein